MSEPTVERFTVFGREGTNCIAVADGHWVRFSDYDALTEECDRLKEIVDGTGLATAAIAAERDRLAKANAELLAGLKNASERLAMIECQTLDQTLTTPVSWMDWAKLVVTIGGEEISALLTKHKATSTEREGE